MEDIRNIGKLDEDKDQKYAFGENLLHRLKEANPGKRLVGFRKNDLFAFSRTAVGTYSIRNGRW